MVLGLKPTAYLHQVITMGFDLAQSVVTACPNLDVLCSDRQTQQTEMVINATVGRELVFENKFPYVDSAYDVVLIDVAPSISMLQNCALVYARRYVVTVAMDSLSLQGVMASVESATLLNKLFKTDIRPLAILPVMVDRRLMMTQTVMATLAEMGAKFEIPILHPIRIDATVSRAAKARKFLVDFDPKSKVVEDYNQTCAELMRHMEIDNVNSAQTAA